MLPVWLAQTGRARSVLATDIRSGPLQNAAALIGRTGTGGLIRLMQTDGLDGLGPQDGDTVILAGMGGETMIGILSRAAWTKEGTRLILEPQSKKADLRRWLIGNGYAIGSERLAEDAGRLYPILCAAGGTSPVYSEAELHLGLLAQIGNDPLFPRYLQAMAASAARAAPHDLAAAGLLEEYKMIEGRLSGADDR